MTSQIDVPFVLIESMDSPDIIKSTYEPEAKLPDRTTFSWDLPLLPSCLELLEPFTPSPTPIGSTMDIRFVGNLSVESDSTLLANSEPLLHCLEPLVKPGQATELQGLSPDIDRRQAISNAISETLQEIDLTEYQSSLWKKRFKELQQFREQHGHCLVPHKWKENLSLATWVKRQRCQWKLRSQGKRSTLTQDRKEALDNLDFVWDSRNASWEERFNELVEFKEEHGHTSVPSTYHNHSLSVWVQCQRRQWKLMQEGHGQIKQSRIAKLHALGFIWEPRKSGC